MKLTKLSDIITNEGTQIRLALDEGVVEEYADAYRAEKVLPPIDVFVKGKKRILADGFHRYAAATKAELKELPCTLHTGSHEDALKFALGANTSHGLRRTNADKRNAAKIALEHFQQMSDPAIADMCGLSQPFIWSVRKELFPPAPINIIPPRSDSNPGGAALPTPDPKNAPEPPPGSNGHPSSAPPPKRIGRDGVARSLPVLPKPEGKKVAKDKTGMIIPPQCFDLWDYANEASGQVTALESLKGIMVRAQEGQNKVFAEVNFQIIKTSLENARSEWIRAIPYAVCPSCQGVTFKDCNGCKGRGFVSKFFWDNCVPEETKKLRAKLVKDGVEF